MTSATAKRPTVTNCRLCGQPFPHRLLASFEGIEVWERRYCIPCCKKRLEEQNKHDAARIQPRQGSGTPEPSELELFGGEA